MNDARLSPRPLRPQLRATSFAAGSGSVAQILTEKQQAKLGTIATEVRARARTTVYTADSPARSIFIIETGTIKAFQHLGGREQRVFAFLFPGDVFGLAENGRYVNSLQTLTPATLYQFPVDKLTDMFRHDGELELRFLCKATYELREAQRQQIIVTRRDAAGRVAMFLRMLEHRSGSDSSRIQIPMSRRDIGRYLGLTPEAISRATASLSREGIVSFPNRQTAQIRNRSRFDQLELAA